MRKNKAARKRSNVRNTSQNRQSENQPQLSKDNLAPDQQKAKAWGKTCVSHQPKSDQSWIRTSSPRPGSNPTKCVDKASNHNNDLETMKIDAAQHHTPSDSNIKNLRDQSNQLKTPSKQNTRHPSPGSSSCSDSVNVSNELMQILPPVEPSATLQASSQNRQTSMLSEYKPPSILRKPSSQPDQVIDLPIIQNVGRQRRLIEKPEIEYVNKMREHVTLQEVIKEVYVKKIVEKEKIVEIPEIKKIQKIVRIPKIVTEICEVTKVEVREILLEVPKIETRILEKIKEIEEIQYIDRAVEIPKYVEELRYIPKPEIIEIPIFREKKVPKVQVERIEKIRHVPGPIEIRYLVREKIVVCPKAKPLEICQKIPIKKDVFNDMNIEIEVPGRSIDVPVPIEKVVDKVVTKYTKGRTIQQRVPVPVEQIIEVPRPHLVEEIRYVDKEKKIAKEVVKYVDVIENVEKFIEVPRYIYVDGPRTVIRPRFLTDYQELPDIQIQNEPKITTRTEQLPPFFVDKNPGTSSGTVNVKNVSGTEPA